MVDDSRQAGAFIDDALLTLAKGRGKQLDSLLRFFEQASEKWYKRPFVTGLPRFEDYVHGDVGFVVKIDRPTTPFKEVYAYKFAVADIDFGSIPELCTKTTDISEVCANDDHIVFVPIVDLPSGPKKLIALFVGSYFIDDEIIQPLEGILHRSAFDASYQFLQANPSWESPFTDVSIDRPLQPCPTAVESGPQTKNSIASSERDFRWDCGGTDVNIPAVIIDTCDSGFFLFFDKISHNRHDKIDVLLGPSYLKPRVSE